tara:strand:+ start:502 stop:705 length:204 start_codon:yes stop_codon:yes gene_type:complete
MNQGDLVWFGFSVDTRNNKVMDWGLGILLEYSVIQKTGTVLYNGSIRRVRGEYLKTAGKNPLENWTA